MNRRDWLKVAGAAVATPGRTDAAPPAASAGAAGSVAVASSVQAAMEVLAPAFSHATGHALRLTFGASGNLVRQIDQGLPVDLFLSADEAFAGRLVATGWARDAGAVYATGRLALVAARGTAIALDGRLLGLKAGWGEVRKFSIANPLLAPYGKAARETLQSVGLWEAAQARLVLGESVAQAAQFVGTGSAQAGLTALSLVVRRAAAGWRDHVAVDGAMHAPLRQRMVLRRQAGVAATAFYDYLQTPAARALLQSHGFGPG